MNEMMRRLGPLSRKREPRSKRVCSAEKRGHSLTLIGNFIAMRTVVDAIRRLCSLSGFECNGILRQRIGWPSAYPTGNLSKRKPLLITGFDLRFRSIEPSGPIFRSNSESVTNFVHAVIELLMARKPLPYSSESSMFGHSAMTSRSSWGSRPTRACFSASATCAAVALMHRSTISCSFADNFSNGICFQQL